MAACSIAALEVMRRRVQRRDPVEGAIPGLKLMSYPLVGHLPAANRLAKDIGSATWAQHHLILENSCNNDGICTLDMPFGRTICVYNPYLIKEFFEKPDIYVKQNVERNKFMKIARRVIGKGLFTAGDEEEEWGIAHRILSKPFARKGMMNFVSLMNGQANKLVRSLASLPEGSTVRVNDWVQKMAFETISVCGMGTSFGSLDSEDKHEFIAAMEEWLNLIKVTGFAIPIFDQSAADKRMAELGEILMGTVREVIRKRRNKETEALGDLSDLLDLMLNSKDEVTGQALSEENIMHQILTFLVAGHDSTAAAMSSIMHFVLDNPRVEARLVEEIRSVVGDGDVTWEHLSKLQYLTWCQNETLRLAPPAPFVTKFAAEDTLLGGKWHVKKGDPLRACPLATHLNPTVWGSDAREFRPERWEAGMPHPYAWFPFSMGPRGCIGKEFSLIEQKIALVKLLQHFVLRVPKTMEPKVQDNAFVGWGLSVNLFSRPTMQPLAAPNTALCVRQAHVWELSSCSQGHSTPLLILHGSNGGSTKAFAYAAGQEARRLGFVPQIAELDAYANLPTIKAVAQHVLIVSATYNGLPPDTAVAFVDRIKASQSQILEGLSYAVFGCGNTQWANSYQKIPDLLDERLQMCGATRLQNRGQGDSAADIDSAFEDWCDLFWARLAASASVKLQRAAAKDGTRQLPEIAVLHSRCEFEDLVPEQGQFQPFEVVDNHELIPNDETRSVRHIELSLPTGATYAAGDHLSVLPDNDPVLVTSLLHRLGLPLDTVICVKPQGEQSDEHPGSAGNEDCGLYKLVNRHLRLFDVFSRCYDLSKSLSGASVERLAALARSEADKRILRSLDKKTLHEMQMPLLEVLERFPSLEPSLPEVFDLLPAMKPRLYSISSSNLTRPAHVSLMVGLLQGTAPSGRLHRGVCSHFLAATAMTESEARLLAPG
eukprot:TRINITY_DN5298_c0_g1_i3.p1 TRINITY_DN5298_c0_g1~~TRINITY_DN5298_c0_g1_i3.p1  ORF type:complete len:983 (+),score=124.01 TRINITY_DN5298_c0_g1_i3:132-2951(+)